MTAFIALCAGTSAAWYFTQKGTDDSGAFGWSLVFGVIWAMLIFCIDRSLVITLKKKENRKSTWWIVPFVSRAALAIIVAFMVSIPLELVIFEDYIKGNEENFKANQSAILGAQLKSNSGEDVLRKQISNDDSKLEKLDGESNKLKKDIDSLQTKINNLEETKSNPQSTEYKNAKRRHDAAQRKYNDAKANNNAGRMREAQEEMSNARRDMGVARKAWEEQQQVRIDELKALRNSKQAERAQKERKYNTISDSQASNKIRVDKITKEREIKEASKQVKLAKGNHFIRNFQILEYAVWQRDKDGNLTDTAQLMFLWLVRILFFIVEILPTVVKIVSPVGSYERMVAAEEKNLIEYLESDEYCDMIKNIHTLALNSQEELQQQQHDVELDLKKSILNQIKAAQLEVAQLAIENWKEQEKAKLTPPIISQLSTSSNDEDDYNMTTFV